MNKILEIIQKESLKMIVIDNELKIINNIGHIIYSSNKPNSIDIIELFLKLYSEHFNFRFKIGDVVNYYDRDFNYYAPNVKIIGLDYNQFRGNQYTVKDKSNDIFTADEYQLSEP